MKYPFETHILVCTGARCNDEKHGDERGEKIREELKDLNRAMGRKPTVRVCAVSCLDICDDGPNIVAYPSGNLHMHLDREKAKKVYEEEVTGTR